MITVSSVASEGSCPVLRRAENHPVVSRHCALMLAARMTFAHLSISHRIRSANSSGVLAIGSNPSAEQALPYVRQRNDSDDLAMQAVDDVLQRSGRHQYAEDDVGFLTRRARFRQRRHVGQRRRTPRAGDGERAHRALLDMSGGGGNGGGEGG